MLSEEEDDIDEYYGENEDDLKDLDMLRILTEQR